MRKTRLVKIYGTPKDPRTLVRLKRERVAGPIRKTHAHLQTSVKPQIQGDIHALPI